ncbi:PepSY domain-containing protein [Thalassospira mesophila]|nr:PepSY domain-containing protein [Thalassospira mesophila]
MKKITLIALTTLTAGLGFVAVTPAMASSSQTNDDAAEVSALTHAKLSAQDAIAIAIKAMPGKVAELQLRVNDNRARYMVTILDADGVEHEMLVDANKGDIIKQSNGDEEADGETNDDDGDGDSLNDTPKNN